MSTLRAGITLIASATLLVVVGTAWAIDAGSQPRADLTGDAVVAPRTPATSPPATIAPVQAKTAPPTTTTVPAAQPSPPTTVFTAPAPSDPQRLTIPALAVDAPIVPVGLEPDGSMEIPGVLETGWYEPGPRPGAPFGSVVIAAHVDFGGAPGVFFDLRTLEVGSEVTVTDEAGRPLTYVVTERFQVDKADVPIDELFRTSGAPTLTLITCGGAFDRGEGHYRDNIVVRAVPV